MLLFIKSLIKEITYRDSMTPGNIKNIPDLLLDYMDLAHILFGSNVTHDPRWADAK